VLGLIVCGILAPRVFGLCWVCILVRIFYARTAGFAAIHVTPVQRVLPPFMEVARSAFCFSIGLQSLAVGGFAAS